MASDASKYLGNRVLRWLAGNAMPTAPVALYLALFNGDPRASGTEVTTTVTSSGRPTITLSAPAANDTDNTMSNSAAVSFGASEGDTTITHVAIFDAASGGKRLVSKALAASSPVVALQPVSFDAGGLQFVFGG